MFLSTRNPFSSPVIVDPEQKGVNVVCIGNQNHNMWYNKMKLLVSLGTWAAKMMQGETWEVERDLRARYVREVRMCGPWNVRRARYGLCMRP